MNGFDRFVDQHFVLAVLATLVIGIVVSAITAPPAIRFGTWLQGTSDRWTKGK